MAEGGYENPAYEDLWEDDDDDDEQEENTTQPFQPGTASTPYHRGKEIEMQMRQHEKSGRQPDTSYTEETSFGGDEDKTTPLLERTGSIMDLQNESTLRQKLRKTVDMIKRKFSRANFQKMKIRRGTGKNVGKVVAVGFRKGEYKILKDDESGFMKSFLDNFKDVLGPTAEEIARQRLTEAENQLKQAEDLAAKREKEELQMKELCQKTEQTQARIDALQSEQGTNVENEAEI